MRIVFAGTRGTAPVCSPDHREFGGDTTCLLITGRDGTQVLVDAGTGVRHAAPLIARRRPVHLLFTHFHLDHLAGLPAWDGLHDRDRKIVMAAPVTDGATVSTAVGGLLNSPYWPVPICDLESDVAFLDLASRSGAEPLRLGDLELRWTPLPHPGGCTAYRLDEPATGASVVVATDCEWETAAAELRRDFVAFAAGCELLVCDGQYEPGETAGRLGWGHTSWQGAVALADEIGCGRLTLTHHDPRADDVTLAARERDLRAIRTSADFARQGLVVELGRQPSA